MCAPFSTAAVTAPAEANFVSSGSGWARKLLREGPTMIGRSSPFNSLSRARIAAFCSLRLPKPSPGSITMRALSNPARRARLIVASKSRPTVAIGSGIGPNFAQVSGLPRI